MPPAVGTAKVVHCRHGTIPRLRELVRLHRMGCDARTAAPPPTLVRVRASPGRTMLLGMLLVWVPAGPA